MYLCVLVIGAASSEFQECPWLLLSQEGGLLEAGKNESRTPRLASGIW